MKDDCATRNFIVNFSKLNQTNQERVVSILQALLFAQSDQDGLKEITPDANIKASNVPIK